MSADMLRKAAAAIWDDWGDRQDRGTSWHRVVEFHLAVADWLKHDAEVWGYFHLSRSNCRENEASCDCTYKDCYEHGKWHDCSHGEPDLTAALAVARAYLGETA